MIGGAHRLLRKTRQVPERLRTLQRYRAWRRPLGAIRWLLLDPETSNFTYEIANEDELVDFITSALSVDRDRVARYVRELAEDTELHERLSERLGQIPHAKRKPLFGRRAGWYAVVRATRPTLTVETGVHDGLGSAAILRALERNAAEGFDGRLVSFDIDPDCGRILDDGLRERWTFVPTPTRSAFTDWVSANDAPIEFFIHDSDHSFEHESFELETFAPRFAPGAAVLTDNPGSRAFPEFCARLGLAHSAFWERPRRHFYPGAGIGLTVLPPR